MKRKSQHLATRIKDKYILLRNLTGLKCFFVVSGNRGQQQSWLTFYVEGTRCADLTQCEISLGRVPKIAYFNIVKEIRS